MVITLVNLDKTGTLDLKIFLIEKTNFILLVLLHEIHNWRGPTMANSSEAFCILGHVILKDLNYFDSNQNQHD